MALLDFSRLALVRHTQGNYSPAMILTLLALFAASSTATEYSSIFDETNDSKLAELAVGFGIPCAACFAISAGLLYLSKGRVARIATWITCCGGKGPLAIMWTARILIFGLPFALLAAWGITAGLVIDPYDIGAVTACAIAYFTLYALALFEWYFHSFQLTRMVQLAFSLAFLALYACLMFIVFDDDKVFDFRVCTAVFLSFNMVIVTKLHFDWTSAIDDFEEYLVTYEKMQPGAEENPGCVQSLRSCLDLGGETSLEGRLQKLKRPKPWWYLIGMHLMSGLILFFYGWAVYKKTPNGQGEYVGVVVAISVAALDVYLHLFRHVGVLRSGELSFWAAFVSRAALVAAGQERWFIGESFLFVILACTICAPMLQVIIPVTRHEDRRNELLMQDAKASESSGVAGESEDKAGVSVQTTDGPAQSSGCSMRKVKVVSLYLTILVLMIIPFAILISLVSHDHVYSPDIHIVNKTQNQANFGAAALLLLLCFIMGYSTYRYLMRAGESAGVKMERYVFYILAVSFYATMVISGIVFYTLSNAHFVLVTAILGPAIILAGFLFLQYWMNNDYEYLDYELAPERDFDRKALGRSISGQFRMGKDPNTGNTVVSTVVSNSESSVPTGAGGAPTEDESLPEQDPEKQAGGQSSDDVTVEVIENPEGVPVGPLMGVVSNYRIVITSLVYSVLSVAYGLWLGFKSDPSWSGLTIGMLLLVVPITVVPLWRYFHKENFDHSITILLLVGLSVIIIYSLILNYHFLDNDSESRLAMLFICLCYPALVSGGVAIKRWHSHEWNMDQWDKILMGISAACAVAFDAATFFAVNWQAGVAVLVLLVLVVYALILLAVWIQNFFFLPRKYRYSVIVLGVVFIVLGALVALGDAFAGFSVIMLVNAALCFAYGFNGLIDTENRKVVFSRNILPGYRLDVKSREMMFHNIPVLALFFGVSILILWGAFAALLLPNPLYGTSMICFLICISFYAGGHASVHLGSRLAAVTEYVDLAMLLSMKSHLLEHCGDAAPNNFFKAGSVAINTRLPQIEEQLTSAWESAKETHNRGAWNVAIEHYLDVCDQVSSVYESEALMTTYLELLVVLSAEFRARQEARQVEQFLRANGIEGVSMEDLSVLNADLLAKLKKHLRANQVEDERRRLLIEQQRSSTSKGQKRALPGICSTVYPIMSQSDEDTARLKVNQAAKDFSDSGGTAQFTDQDMQPYNFRGMSDWKRLGTMAGKDAKLFHGGTEAADTQQGSLGDCWLIAAMSAVAGDANLDNHIENMFLDHNVDAGIYSLKMYHQNQPYAVILDDHVPARGNRTALAKSKTEGELWVSILEKACAKLYHNALGEDDQPMKNGYDQLSGGLVYKGVKIFTNAPTRCVTHSASSDVVVSGKLWTDLKRWHECGYFIGAGSGGDDDTQKNDVNIVQGHAFSLMDLCEIQGFQLMRLRNPWGKTEFEGDWSDHSIMWERYPKVKRKLNPKVADDGEFWIQFQDYVRYFDVTDCAIFTSPDKWESKEFTFTGPEAGEPANKYSADRNPTLWLETRKELEVVLDVVQPNRKEMGKEHHVSFYHAQERGRVRVKNRYSGRRMLSTGTVGSAKEAELLRVQDDAHVFVITWDSDTPANLVFPVQVTIRYRKVDAQYLDIQKADPHARAL